MFAISAFAIVANQVAAEPGDSMLGLGMVVIGLPIYYIWARKSYTGPTEEEVV